MLRIRKRNFYFSIAYFLVLSFLYKTYLTFSSYSSSQNLKTVIQVSQARGVALLAASQMKIPVAEYTPLQIKQAVTSYGRADKVQVQKMVKILLGLKEIPKPDDAADALAVAICCANSLK